MKVGKVCEYKKQKKKGKISCTEMVRIKNGCYNTINPKNRIRGGLMHKKNWIFGIYHIL